MAGLDAPDGAATSQRLVALGHDHPDAVLAVTDLLGLLGPVRLVREAPSQ